MVQAPITFGYVDFHPSDAKRISQVYKSGQYSPGPMCRQFEDQFKALHGRKHAFFVNSGTDALRIALLALKEKYAWPKGSSVMVPSITFVATINTIIQAGLNPLLIDVGMYDYNLNAYAMEHFLNTVPDPSFVKAVMPVHLFGQIADMKEIMAVAKKYNLRVIEDSCESVLSTQAGKLCGTFGDISCFSTYQCHILTTGVGGIAMTNDGELNKLMRSYANHGRDTMYLPGYCKPKLSAELIDKRFSFVRNGYSSRPDEFAAALGIGQLERLQKNVDRRRAVADAMLTALLPFEDQFKLPLAENGRTHSYMMFPIVIHEYSKVNKAEFVLHLERAGIETRNMMPITSQPVYKSWMERNIGSVTKWINENGFYIPCHPGITKRDIERIRAAFLDFL